MEACADPAALHAPVLPAEVLAALAPVPGATAFDGTLGLGGHSELLLRSGCRVLGVDRDPAARALAARRLAWAGDALAIMPGTFASAAEDRIAAGERFDLVLADLGVSSMQLDDGDRGFSIRSATRADMRMGDGCSADAIDLIRRLSEHDLADIIWRYGEERRSRQVAGSLKRMVAEHRISGEDLAEAVRRAIPGHHKRHPAGRTFQALRIAVNDELGELERLLSAIPRLLNPGGRAVVISFHSLEDRLVKHAFRDLVAEGTLAEHSRGVIEAGPAELAANPRAASAKLRWARAHGTTP